MNIVNSLFNPLLNCEHIIFKVCELLEVPVTRSSVIKETVEHPDYPSMLTISDVLSGLGVENASAKLALTEDLTKLDTPFVVQISKSKHGSKLFSIIYKIEGNTVEWENPTDFKREKIALEEFRKYFTGFVQVLAKTDHAGEIDYTTKKKSEVKANFINNLLLFAIPAITVAISILTFSNYGLKTIPPIVYTLLLLAGAVVSGLLIVYEIGEYNPTLNRVCSGGKKINCSAILESNGATVFGISWSVIGFSYFLGILITLLSSGLTNFQLLKSASWLNISALPYIIYSVYYQARVVKQWCPMCLTVQAILLALFITSLSGGFVSEGTTTVYAFASLFINSMVIAIAAFLLLKALEKAKSAQNLQQSLQRLKHNPTVFDSLFNHSKKVTSSPDGLGIILGNPHGKIHLIKVCNPYCGPCAQAHPVIENMLKSNSEIKLQIIYTVSETDGDWRNKPVKTFLSLDKNGDKEHISNALDTWYGGIEYNQFEQLYPITQETLDAQVPSIKKMREWCEKTEIEYTPTFFVNGSQLPRIYSFQDLRYLFSA